VLCELPPGPDAAAAEQDVMARAAARGLAVAPLAPYRVAGRHDRPALIVGYGTPPEHAFSGAVARLCAVLREAA
jgi:GntR family transcriptional regulator/MocR family aminotransferase